MTYVRSIEEESKLFSYNETQLSSATPMVVSNNGTVLPVDIPVTLGVSGTLLPITIPFVLGAGSSGPGSVEIPLTLPFIFSSEEASRKEIKLNTRVTSEFILTQRSFKIGIKEQALGKFITIPMRETALSFEGFVIEENVVAKMSSSLVLMEEVRNRILVDVSLMNRNTLMLKWYGQEVEKFDIMLKPFIAEEYVLYSTHSWKDGYALVNIDDNAYYIQLIGKSGSGESFELEIDVNTPVGIKSDVTISLNEKIYDIDVNYTSQYRFVAEL